MDFILPLCIDLLFIFVIMFPDFNIYSLPLLILVTQGLILAILLFRRYFVDKEGSDIVLAVLVLITCYHRTTFTVGFMGWYDTFHNTKINYYLIHLVLAVGPLIYFYIKASIQRNFKFTKRIFVHFIPALIYAFFKIAIYLYDSNKVGFSDTQNGVLYLWSMDHLSSLISVLTTLHLLIYIVYSFRLYYSYRSRLQEEYSNTYKYELRWLHNFLLVFTFLFVYDTIQMLTDGLIFDLHWTQEWWYQFFSLLVVIYVGVMGYFTSLDDLKKVELKNGNEEKLIQTKDSFQYGDELERLCNLVEREKLFLDANLTLSQLSKKSKINTSQLSYIINNGLNKNFNDFINEYRIETVKTQLLDPSKNQLSILAIAYDCGFNSKATFNRVFKKLSGMSPSVFRSKLTI